MSSSTIQPVPIWTPDDYAEVAERLAAIAAGPTCPAQLRQYGEVFPCEVVGPHEEHENSALAARWVAS